MLTFRYSGPEEGARGMERATDGTQRRGRENHPEISAGGDNVERGGTGCKGFGGVGIVDGLKGGGIPLAFGVSEKR
jgi:hypothetical protein